MRTRYIPFLVAAFAGAGFTATGSSPADQVNPLIGTANDGQTYPAAGVPIYRQSAAAAAVHVIGIRFRSLHGVAAHGERSSPGRNRYAEEEDRPAA